MVLVFLAAWRRPEITEICFMGIARLRASYPIETMCVISEEEMIPLCEKYKINWTFYKNNPVGEKKNHGLDEAMKLKWDYLLEIGSDDIVKNELIELYKPHFGKLDLFGTKRSVIINSENGDCRELASDTPYGLGRCISRSVIEKHCHVVECMAHENIIAPGRTTKKGDTNFFKLSQADELQKLGRLTIIGQPRYRLWKDDINKGLDNNSDFFLMTQGVQHKGIKTDKPLTIDIKGQDNIWPFNPKLGTAYDLNRALEGLSVEEQSAIFSLFKKRNIEYAHNL